MSEKVFRRALLIGLLCWAFACGIAPIVVTGCATRSEIVKPSAGKIVVPPQCFLPMYCKTPECIGAQAQYHCYAVVPDEPKGDSK